MRQRQRFATLWHPGQHPAQRHRRARREVERPAQPRVSAAASPAFDQQHRLEVRQVAELERRATVVEREEHGAERLVLADRLRRDRQVEGERLLPGVAAGDPSADRLRLHRPIFERGPQAERRLGGDTQIIRREGGQRGRAVIAVRLDHLPPPDRPDRHDTRQPDAPAIARFQGHRWLVRLSQPELPDLVVVEVGAPGAGVGGDTRRHRGRLGKLPLAHDKPLSLCTVCQVICLYHIRNWRIR